MRGVHCPGHADALPVFHVGNPSEFVTHPPPEVTRDPRIPNARRGCNGVSCFVLVDIKVVVLYLLLFAVPLVVRALIAGINAE